MHKVKILAALAVAASLGACAGATEGQRALLDDTGTVVGYLPESEVKNTPPGTAFRLNINGRDQTVTLGQRQSAGDSAGTPVLGQLNRHGAPSISYAGPGAGNLAPAGEAYVARIDNGTPIIGYRTPPAASGQQPLQTTP